MNQVITITLMVGSEEVVVQVTVDDSTQYRDDNAKENLSKIVIDNYRSMNKDYVNKIDVKSIQLNDQGVQQNEQDVQQNEQEYSVPELEESVDDPTPMFQEEFQDYILPTDSLGDIWCRPTGMPDYPDLGSYTLSIIFREDIQRKLNDRKTLKKRVWEEVGSILKRDGFIIDENIKNAGERLSQKYRNWIKLYKIYIDKINSTGTGPPSNIPKYFDIMHPHMSNRVDIIPSFTISSMPPPSPRPMTTPFPAQSPSTSFIPTFVSSDQSPSLCPMTTPFPAQSPPTSFIPTFVSSDQSPSLCPITTPFPAQSPPTSSIPTLLSSDQSPSPLFPSSSSSLPSAVSIHSLTKKKVRPQPNRNVELLSYLKEADAKDREERTKAMEEMKENQKAIMKQNQAIIDLLKSTVSSFKESSTRKRRHSSPDNE